MAKNELKALELLLDVKRQEKAELSINDIIQNPISCGYLLDFCQKQYCDENVNFFLAVDKYKDQCTGLDFRDTKTIETCKLLADKIWSEFLSVNSPCEVSLPSEDRLVTMERLKTPEAFGAKLFDVALQDAVKTLQKDTLGRFLKSNQFTDMKSKVQAVSKFMGKKPLDLVDEEAYFPAKVTITDERISSCADYTIQEIVNDRILFREMLAYLESKYKTENLKCARHIVRFEELAQEGMLEEMKEHAWNIYLLFVALGSIYEVSCTAMVRKSVQLGLGCPARDMFESVKESSVAVLKQDLKAFCAQLQPRDLKERLREVRQNTGKKPGFLAKMKVF